MADLGCPHIFLLEGTKHPHYQLESSYELFLDKFGITREHMDLDGRLELSVMEPRQGEEGQAGMDVSSASASA